MKIYFAGLSGISNIERLEIWRKYIAFKLISYFEIKTGDGKREYNFLRKIKK